MSVGNFYRPNPFDTLQKWEQYLTDLRSLPPELHGELPYPQNRMIRDTEAWIKQRIAADAERAKILFFGKPRLIG